VCAVDEQLLPESAIGHNRPMSTRITIIGAGTGGTLTANRLRREYGDDAEITVIDTEGDHVYQPGLLFVPFGMADPENIVRPRSSQIHDGIRFLPGSVDRVDIESDTVHLEDGTEVPYDVLVIASGARLLPEETEGLTGPGWGERVFSFYEMGDATRLRDALAEFDGGRVVVNPIEMPVKCPVAPLEFCFLLDWFLHKQGLREKSSITYVTPLDGAFTKPVASKELGDLLEKKGIALETEFATGEVDGKGGRLVSWDEREVPFDLLVAIPVHGGAEFVSRSPGLGDDLGYVKTDAHTLQSAAAPNVFAIGDATNLPTSKAGSVTHFEGETLVANIERFLKGEDLEGSFDGHANCFIETGFHKALLIDFNYEVEPLPGRYPAGRAGPLPLLRESRLNHMAKLAFQPFYWHALLPGRDVPGVGSDLSMAGKQSAPSQEGDAE
jgi:sulfide:quinone oxidoreductase